MKIGTRTFRGMSPVVDPHELPPSSATLALNCKLQSGSAQPWAVPLVIQSAPNTGSIFLYNAIWLSWVSELISAVLSPIANDSHGRLYWTGEGAPKYATETMIGTSNAPNSSLDLGIPAPVNAPVAAAVGLSSLLAPLYSISMSYIAGKAMLTVVTEILDNVNSNALLSYHSTDIATLDEQLLGFTIISSPITGSFGAYFSTFRFLTIDGVTSIGHGDITAITKANPAVVTSVGHNLKTDDTLLLNIAGMTELNGVTSLITVVSDDTFSLNGINSTAYGTFTSGTFDLTARSFVAEAAVNITAAGGDNISKADPAKITHVAHGLTTGQTIVLSNMVGMTQIDDINVKITYVDADNFTLDGINSTAYGTFVSGTYAVTPMLEVAVDTLQQESRSYVYRYRSEYGEVGPPSPASTAITVSAGQTVTITGMDTAPAGDYDIADKEIYRTNTGSDTTAYQFVDEVTVATTGYTDTTQAEDLGEVLDSLLWDGPPAELQGLCAHPCGSLVGYVGNLLCFSVPYQPHAWPVTNQYPVKDTIMGIGVYGNNVAVTTTGAPYVATGSNPSSMNVDRLEKGYGNLSSSGVVDIGYAVAYPSTLGLMMVSTGDISLLTEKVLSIQEWQAYDPATFRGYFYGGCYFALGDSESLVFNFNTGDLSELDQLVTAAHHDPATGSLHLVVGGDIVKWDAGASNLTMTWRSKKHVLPRPANMSCGQVRADSYPLTLTLYGDGAVKATVAVADSKPFRLPGGYLCREFQYSIEGAFGVYSIIIAESMSELGEV